MTAQQAGPGEVRPNVLRDQRAPNTFQSSIAPGNPAKQRDLNRGGGNAGPPRRLARPQLSSWVTVVVLVLVILIVLYVLQGAP